METLSEMGKLFYGTQTGTTEYVAEKIQQALSDLIDESKCIFKVKAHEFDNTDFLVLGGSTWGDGELTDDWADFFPQLDRIDFTGKTIALFSLGDQHGYGYNFVSAMRLLYDKVKERGAVIIGDNVPIEGFDYSHSESVIDDHFIGLAVDEVNEPELTDDRIAQWASLVRDGLAAGVV
jgi:flavodoxin long chain